MRTLFLAPELFATDGGIPRILRLYLKSLCEQPGVDDRVGFVALNDHVVDDKELRTYTNSKLASWMACSRNKKRFVKACLKQSRHFDQILCGHVGQLPVALVAKLFKPSLKYYVVAHGIEVWGKLSIPKQLALKYAERVICVSEFTRERLLQRFKLNPQRCVVLHNALDPAFSIEPGVPAALSPPTILTISRLCRADRYKGVDHLIAAMPLILQKEPTAVLKIIGRGDDMPRLQKIAQKHGLLQKSVQFLGYVDDNTMVDEIKSCRLFSLPSRDEGFGLVYLEAMARGRPCLGIKVGAASEVITDKTGVFAEYADIASIAESSLTALHRDWNEQTILDRAALFSYSRFRDELGLILNS